VGLQAESVVRGIVAAEAALKKRYIAESVDGGQVPLEVVHLKITVADAVVGESVTVVDELFSVGEAILTVAPVAVKVQIPVPVVGFVA
jgi:hypothetical protein